MFGGEPFEILSSDRHTVVTMLDIAAPLLGDLRCQIEANQASCGSTLRRVSGARARRGGRGD
jgi:hypothetical protein